MRRYGSSPRERGTRILGPVLRELDRIIPARAGNTPPRRNPCQGPSDHPRASGEHQQGASHSRMAGGSSPRERGTLCERAPESRLHRIIPARAGNTAETLSLAIRETDHPRASGEHWNFHWLGRRLSGSSPRERGTLSNEETAIVARRIIPARAGNTAETLSLAIRETDHPRASGEHWNFHWLGRRLSGSSPRERGTQQQLRWVIGEQRIIPARAGNTLPDYNGQRLEPDHPRASGEHQGGRGLDSTTAGSSPRERGTQFHR